MLAKATSDPVTPDPPNHPDNDQCEDEALFRLSLALRVLGEHGAADERLLDAESALHRAARRLSEEDAETFTSERSPGREIVAGAGHLRRRAAERAAAADDESNESAESDA